MQRQSIEQLSISSPAFKNGGLIPEYYSCNGHHSNPPFKIDGIPSEAAALVLLMEDIDAPDGSFDHWIIWDLNVPGAMEEKKLNGIYGGGGFDENVYGTTHFRVGVHRYLFKLYVLDKALELPATTGKEVLLLSMKEYVIAESEIMGRYTRRFEAVQNVAVA
jgi:Raf kinase inhibitor-like YbhB/YbcL family protein